MGCGWYGPQGSGCCCYSYSDDFSNGNLASPVSWGPTTYLTETGGKLVISLAGAGTGTVIGFVPITPTPPQDPSGLNADWNRSGIYEFTLELDAGERFDIIFIGGNQTGFGYNNQYISFDRGLGGVFAGYSATYATVTALRPLCELISYDLSNPVDVKIEAAKTATYDSGGAVEDEVLCVTVYLDDVEIFKMPVAFYFSGDAEDYLFAIGTSEDGGQATINGLFGNGTDIINTLPTATDIGTGDAYIDDFAYSLNQDSYFNGSEYDGCPQSPTEWLEGFGYDDATVDIELSSMALGGMTGPYTLTKNSSRVYENLTINDNASSTITVSSVEYAIRLGTAQFRRLYSQVLIVLQFQYSEVGPPPAWNTVWQVRLLYDQLNNGYTMPLTITEGDCPLIGYIVTGAIGNVYNDIMGSGWSISVDV